MRRPLYPAELEKLNQQWVGDEIYFRFQDIFIVQCTTAGS